MTLKKTTQPLPLIAYPPPPQHRENSWFRQRTPANLQADHVIDLTQAHVARPGRMC